MRRTIALFNLGPSRALILACGLMACGHPAPAPASRAPVPTTSASTLTVSEATAVGAALPAKCRPEIQGQAEGASATADALEAFFDRVLGGEGYRDATEASAPEVPLVVAEIKRLSACPRAYVVESVRGAGTTSGVLQFTESELGTLQAGTVVRSGYPSGASTRLVLHLYSLDRSFHAARGRAALLPFLARAPRWIPSGVTACWDRSSKASTSLALFRSPQSDVLCAARGERSRCYSFDAPPRRLRLDIADGDLPLPLCAVGDNIVFGPDLDLRVVPPRTRPLERGQIVQRLGGDVSEGAAAPAPRLRASTELVGAWKEIDAGAFPVAAASDLALEELDQDVVGVDAPAVIQGAELFCVRIDGAFRCTQSWPLPGAMHVRSADGATVVSIADHSYDHAGFVTFMRGEGAALVTLGRFPMGARAITFDSDDVQTLVEQRWDYVHEAPRCLRVSGARAQREVSRFRGEHFEQRRSVVPVVYGAAPSALPGMAPPMAAPDPKAPDAGGAIADLRGSWRLEGDAWKRVAGCKANQ